MTKAVVGLRRLVYAKLLTDTTTGVTYDEVKRLAPAINANINRNSSSTSLYADDGVTEVATSTGETELELGVADIPQEVQADLLGHEIRAGVLIRSNKDVAPYVAIGFESECADGTYKMVWLYKGKFQAPSQEHNTKGESIEFQTRTITGRFANRDFDGITDIEANSGTTGLPAGLIDGWFDEVVQPADLVATP
jgi:phi13 family phage major tail protein